MAISNNKINKDGSTSKYWEEKQCLQCGSFFMVRKCYTKRGNGKFCSVSCATSHRNLIDNPAKHPEVKKKISANHADVSGNKNPMYGRRGSNAPGYIDGRNSFVGDPWRRVAFANKPHVCELCGAKPKRRSLHVHHVDRNRLNNNLENLMIVCVSCHNNVLHADRLRNSLGQYA